MEERYQDSQIGDVLRTSHQNAEVKVFIAERQKDIFDKDIISPEEELVSVNVMTEDIPPITESMPPVQIENTFDVETANFMHVVPDSQFYTKLYQLKSSIEMLKRNIGLPGVNLEGEIDYILVGINNTINKGYYLERGTVVDEGLVPLREPFNKKKVEQVDDQDFDEPHANKHNT